MTVFLDTVGLIAAWDESDQWHAAAESALANLLVTRAELLTTTFVLAECGNAAARRPYRAAVTRLRSRLEATGRLVTPTDEEWRNAWTAYGRGGADSAGFVDQISFNVMRRLGLSTAFTNDRHFAAAGFEVLF